MLTSYDTRNNVQALYRDTNVHILLGPENTWCSWPWNAWSRQHYFWSGQSGLCSWLCCRWQYTYV